MHPEVLDKKRQEIFSQLKSFNDFYLAGGTALALQIGHRISVDFDFFSGKEIPKNLLKKVNSVFADKTVAPSVNNPDELTVFVNEIKITFLKYPFPVMLNFIDYEGVKLLATKEIATSKAYTIGRRGSYKDYIDLYFLISEAYCSLNDIMKLAEKKYKDEFNSRLFLEQLVYLEDVKDTAIIFLKDEITKNNLQKFFADEIKKIKL